MAESEEKLKALEAQLKEAKAKKAPPAEIKALNDQVIELRKQLGAAKKAAKPKDEGEDGDEGGGAAAAAKPAKAEEKKAPAKAAKSEAAPKAEPKAEAPKADAPKADAAPKEAAKPAAKKGGAEKKPAKDAPKEGAAAEASPSEAAPKDAAPKEAAPKKSAERKKSEKQEAAPKEAERKKSEKQTEKHAAGDADVDQLAEGVKAVDIKGAKGKKEHHHHEETKKEHKPSTTEEAVTVHHGTGGKIKIVGISGSLRKGSWNSGLIRFCQKNVPEGVEFVQLDISKLPFFNQDLENSPNEEVKAFKSALASADGIVIATPEYNYSFPGVLKNAIDVASRPYGQSSWDGKAVGLISAAYSAGGGVRAQMALRQSFVFLNVAVNPGHEVLIGSGHTKFDGDGNLTDADSQNHVRDYLASFHKFILRRKAGIAAVP